MMTRYLDWMIATFVPDDGDSTGPLLFLFVARVLTAVTVLGCLMLLLVDATPGAQALQLKDPPADMPRALVGKWCQSFKKGVYWNPTALQSPELKGEPAPGSQCIEIGRNEFRITWDGGKGSYGCIPIRISLHTRDQIGKDVLHFWTVIAACRGSGDFELEIYHFTKSKDWVEFATSIPGKRE